MIDVFIELCAVVVFVLSMLLERSAPSHGTVAAVVVVVVVEILVDVVRHAMTRLRHDVQHLIQTTAVSLVMSVVITHMTAHAREVVVTVEDTGGSILHVLLISFCKLHQL